MAAASKDEDKFIESCQKLDDGGDIEEHIKEIDKLIKSVCKKSDYKEISFSEVTCLRGEDRNTVYWITELGMPMSASIMFESVS